MNRILSMFSSSSSWSAAIVGIGLATCSVGVGEKPASDDPFARLTDPEPSVRAAAVSAVGRGNDPRAKAALTRAVADPEHDVQLAAARVLAAMKEPAVLDDLFPGHELLRSSQSNVRP